VIVVARSFGLTQAQVTRDFGISENTVQRWVKKANIDDGRAIGAAVLDKDHPPCCVMMGGPVNRRQS
jgi:transposase-like protein